jgi:hypothetical protein
MAVRRCQGNQDPPPAEWLFIRDARSLLNAGDFRRAVIDAPALASASGVAIAARIARWMRPGPRLISVVPDDQIMGDNTFGVSVVQGDKVISSSSRQPAPTPGAKVTASHCRHCHVMWPPWQPPAHGMCPTNIRPGPSRWPRWQRCGGSTIQDPSMERTRSPTPGMESG